MQWFIITSIHFECRLGIKRQVLETAQDQSFVFSSLFPSTFYVLWGWFKRS